MWRAVALLEQFSPLQPVTNGTSSRELGLRPAAAKAFPWAMAGEPPSRNSKARWCWQDLHDPASGFRAEALVLNDTATGLVGRAVWTDDRGDQVFSELKGQGTSTGSHIVGTFLGGTGRYAGATGSYEFSWRFVLETEDGTVQGQSEGLNGKIRAGPAQATPDAGGATMKISSGLLIRRVLPFVLALGIWFSPVPAGLTAPAWHLFAVFVSAIVAVLVGAFPLLTSTMIAVAAVVLTGTITPAQAFGGFANASVLLVVIAFLVAQAVVKSGLGRRISLFMVSRFGRSSMGLAYSIVLTDAVIAPAFPSNTARGGVLFPIVLSVAEGSGSKPDDPEGRRLGGYLMFCTMASLAVSSALWMTATSANPIGIQVARQYGIQIGFGKWLVASCVPALISDPGPALADRPAVPATRGRDAGGSNRRP